MFDTEPENMHAFALGSHWLDEIVPEDTHQHPQVFLLPLHPLYHRFVSYLVAELPFSQLFLGDRQHQLQPRVWQLNVPA